MHMVQRQKQIRCSYKVPWLSASILAIEVRAWSKAITMPNDTKVVLIKEIHHLLEGHGNTKVPSKVCGHSGLPGTTTGNKTTLWTYPFPSFGPCGTITQVRNWWVVHTHWLVHTLQTCFCKMKISVTGSWYHGPALLCYQRVVEENFHTLGIMSVNGSLYHGPEGEFFYRVVIPRTRTSSLSASCWCEFSHITHLTHIRISTAHLNTSLSEVGFEPGGTRSQNTERHTNYHENSTSVLGPEVSESDVMIAGTWTMLVIMSVKGSWYHGPEHLCYQRVVEENYHTLGIMSVNGSLYKDDNRQQDNILSHCSFFSSKTSFSEPNRRSTCWRVNKHTAIPEASKAPEVHRKVQWQWSNKQAAKPQAFKALKIYCKGPMTVIK